MPIVSRPATVFVPGHVTGFFTVQPDENPLAAGSRGAGLTLTRGVTVSVAPGSVSRVQLGGETIEIAPVKRVLDRLDVTGAIDIETQVPMGAGFGVSGAAALGTALAVNAGAELGRSENELVGIAHAAEVASATGLGDVVAQGRGGAPIRLAPGAPGHGALDGIPARRPVEYVSFGSRSTEAVLANDTDPITAAGEHALSSVREQPTLERFMTASRAFSRTCDLETERVTAVIDDVEAAGGQAAMAMIGRTVFALDSGLTDAGYEATGCEIASAGAHLTID